MPTDPTDNNIGNDNWLCSAIFHRHQPPWTLSKGKDYVGSRLSYLVKLCHDKLKSDQSISSLCDYKQLLISKVVTIRDGKCSYVATQQGLVLAADAWFVLDQSIRTVQWLSG